MKNRLFQVLWKQWCIAPLILSVCIVIPACKPEKQLVTNIADELNKRLIVSEKCDMILYSSNNANHFGVSVISGFFAGHVQIEHLKLSNNKNLYPQSISCDCSMISLVEEDNIGGGFKLLMLERSKNKLDRLTKAENGDAGFSMFAPETQILAYLHQGRLKLYDFRTRLLLKVITFSEVSFKNLIWSVKGKYIYLDGDDGAIWKYDLKGNTFRMVWEPRSIDYTADRMISPSAENDEDFYFLSDSDSEFLQIYKYSGSRGASIVVNSNHDKFLLKRPIKENHLVFRISKDLKYSLQERSSDTVRDIKPFEGVVYDYYLGDYQKNILLYSDFATPASILVTTNGSMKNLTSSQMLFKKGYLPKTIRSKKGILNLVYFPRTPVKGWLLWLHGGPHEQMSMRYNTYLSTLLDNGWGIIAVNYPGSTGIGNKYEMIGEEQNLLKDQVSGLRNDLLDIRRTYPQITKYGIIGVSYGSKVASAYAKLFRSELSSIIDFSGINDVSYPVDIPLLYLYGERDYSLNNPDRMSLIQTGKATHGVSTLELKDEGHIISKKESHIAVLNKLLSFLSNQKI